MRLSGRRQGRRSLLVRSRRDGMSVGGSKEKMDVWVERLECDHGKTFVVMSGKRLVGKQFETGQERGSGREAAGKL
jgi:hypothetical protein